MGGLWSAGPGSHTTLLWDREEVEAALKKRRSDDMTLAEWRRARAAQAQAQAEALDEFLAQREGAKNGGDT
jgi:hypothetical protein